MSKVQKVSTGYNPRPHQQYLHDHVKRFSVVLCHRRFGKTVFAIHEMIDRVLRSIRKNPQAAYFAPTYGQAKRIAWDYLKDAVKAIPGVTINESELRIDMPHVSGRARIMLLGAENPGSIRGLYLDYAVLDEFAEMDERIWTEVVRPALSDRNGGALFIFTPKGNNHAHSVYMAARKDTSGEWYVGVFRASDTNIIPKRELEYAKLVMGEEVYAQEYECDFSAALVGAYYKVEMGQMEKSGRITRVPYDNHVVVHTGWDLGIDDSTAIWFMQEIGRELHAIEYYEINSRGLPAIIKDLQEKPYVYGYHFLPHDAAARELGTGKTRVESMRSLGLKNVEVVKKLGIEDGIHAVRGILPRMWIDRENCAWGVDALKSYERMFDHKEQIFKARPRHNWASHCADAMRTFAVGYRGDSDVNSKKDLPFKSESDYDVMGW